MRRSSLMLAAVMATVAAARTAGPFLTVDDKRIPIATISWPTGTGETKLQTPAPYASQNERIPLEGNIEAFVMVGGTRWDKAAGHPSGCVVRVGFYKKDVAKPFFEGIRNGARLTVTLRNVAYNQAVSPRPASTLQHIKYALTDVLACGLTDKHQDQYNTADPKDTLNGAITAENGRLGILGAGGEAGGTVTLTVEKDGSVTMEATFPYALLRHVRDPWLRTEPGTFFEPTHFHVEFEVLPVDVAAPLDGGKGPGSE